VSADGRLAVVRVAAADGRPSPVVRLVAVADGSTKATVRHDGPVTAVALSAGGKLLATGGEDRVVRLWNVRTGKLLRALRGHVGPIAALAFSRRGTLLGSASTDGEARVWGLNGKPVSVLSGHTNFLEDIAFSPDGEQVVTASRDRTAKTWKAETGSLLATYAGASEAVTSAAFTADGLGIVTASDDGSARVWDAVVQPELPLVASLGAPVTALAFVDAGRSLAATAGGRSYRIPLPDGPPEDVGPARRAPAFVSGPGGVRARITGKTVTVTHGDGSAVVLRGHKDRVTSVAFSPDGTTVLTASWDHDARVWDAATGAPLQVLRAHFAVVSDARYSPDGRWIVTAGPGTAGLWSAATGTLISYFRGHEGKLLSAAFAPDSRRFATGGADGTVRMYRCTICGGIDDLVSLADERLSATGRAATDEERRRFGL
jgi:WD40 repeat protein